MNAITNEVHPTRIVSIEDLRASAQVANDVEPRVDDLIVQLRARSRRAAAEMVERFTPSMRRVARSRACAADAEDIVQEAMLIALTATKLPDSVEGLGRWLHGVVYRLANTRNGRRAGEDLVDAVACLEDATYDFDPPNAARGEEP
jgi:DNA-directed RNA polymerase specialized sigma24 family protein